MTPAEALDASIAHWAKNARAQTPEEATTGPSECALCMMFWALPLADSCDGCPVMKRTGQRRCNGTPYKAAEFALDDWDEERTPENRAAFIAAATAEHDFLVSLRETVS